MAFALTKLVAQVVGLDPTPAMLAEARAGGEARNLSNVEWLEGWAEELPFPDASFDLVTCRIAAHHFADVEKAVGEMARVLRPGGKVLLIDTCAPDQGNLDF